MLTTHSHCVNIYTSKGGRKLKKDTSLHIRLTDEEKVEALKKAEKNGLTISSYIRMLLKKNK